VPNGYNGYPACQGRGWDFKHLFFKHLLLLLGFPLYSVGTGCVLAVSSTCTHACRRVGFLPSAKARVTWEARHVRASRLATASAWKCPGAAQYFNIVWYLIIGPNAAQY